VIKTGRYFARAEFAIDWPVQFLVGVVGVLLVFFEGSLGLWSLFYGSTPLLLLVFLYWMMLHYEKFVPVLLLFVIGLISDILFPGILGGRAAAYILVLYYVSFRRVKLLQSDFMQIWLDFVIVVTGVMLLQLLIFSLINFEVPAITPILFQVGTTLILFPIGYLTLLSLASLFDKVRVSS
tara:strand:- start:119 stop:658 length:540 start_codon:yes stop_codon:yes gene_type:complete